MRRLICWSAALALLLWTLALPVSSAQAADIAHASFVATWQRVDQPVATGQVSRTWLWGPGANSPLLLEPYAESPGATRRVQYFDKSRMEITQPGGDPGSIWYVTNGLLARELITGAAQLGDNAVEQHAPATLNVAGDADDPAGPTYATFASLLAAPPAADGAALTWRLDRAGHVVDDPTLATQGATAAQRVSVPGLEHQIASPFWTFMNASGVIYQGGDYVEAALFANPYYATGYPLTEAYWVTVRVAGVPRDVLTQCFERRCLTWTPSNPAGWQVEAGNVGQHYYAWRYGQLGATPVLAPPPTTGDARVTHIESDPSGDEGHEEYVEITNFDAQALDLTGWALKDASGYTYTFPTFTLPLGATVTVHACDGVDSATTLYTHKCSPIWNNGGDTAYLYDAGGTLVSTFAY
jgi:hypothetical protein